MSAPGQGSPGAGRFELGTDGPKVLLVGIDGSTTSLRAGFYAAGLARRQGSHLVVLYVAHPGGWTDMTAAGAVANRQANDEIAADLRRQVAERAEGIPMGCTFRVEYGDPYTEHRLHTQTRATAD